MNTHLKIILFSISIIFIECKNKSETTYPIRKNIVESVYAAGVVKSKNQYDVSVKLNGKIESVFVKEGDTVQRGSPLFQLENSSTILSTQNARVYALTNDYQQNKSQLIEAQNAIDLAKKKLTNDSILLVRQKSLWEQNIGTKMELEQKELNYENAKLNLKKAMVSYENLNLQLKLVSEQSKNNFQIAKTIESDMMIRSELNGVVYKINAKQGEFANGVSPLAVIGERDFIIEFNVDELDIVQIKKGQKVVVRLDSYKDQLFNAEVSFIYPMMDERKRSFRVEAMFIETPKVLYPNLTLEANIIINEKNETLTIPKKYLVNDSAVMLEDGSILPVTVGLKDYNTVEIIRGIDETTKILLPNK
jgi:HlyD family secretion protein